MGLVGKAVDRITEWWTRTSWGWLVILGPVICYFALEVSNYAIGMTSYNRIQLDDAVLAENIRQGMSLTLYDVGGRLELGLTAILFFLVALFSIIWSLPQIFAAFRNPFGGLLGVAIPLGLSAALYLSFLGQDYNFRSVFANDLLIFAEREGGLSPLNIRFELFGVSFINERLSPEQVMMGIHSFVYFFTNAAPWCLITMAAVCASFEPRATQNEAPQSLRRRMTGLQIAVVLAAANLVLAVVYTRALISWGPGLFDEEVAAEIAYATTRYTITWGAIGTLLLISALVPAYVSLMRQIDRVANYELSGGDPSIHVHYADRLAWRLKHGLVVSTTQVLTTGAAVIAPVMTGPALETGAGVVDTRPGAHQESRLLDDPLRGPHFYDPRIEDARLHG